MAEALPHGGCLGLADTPAIVDGAARVRHLLDPIGEAAQELAIIVGKAGGEIERAVRSIRAYGTGGYTELAFEAGVVVDGVVIIAGFTLHEHGSQQHEIVNQIAVNAHVTEPSFDRDRLMRDNPDDMARSLIHLHGEAHRQVDCPNATRFKPGHDCRADLVDPLDGTQDWLPTSARRARARRHAYNEA